MDEIIILINKITQADVVAMQESFATGEEFPPRVLALYHAIKLYESGLNNLCHYNKDEKNKPIISTPLSGLDTVQLYQIMFAGVSLDDSLKPVAVGLAQALQRYFKENEEEGAKFIVGPTTQDFLTDVMVPSIALNAEQLSAAIARVRRLQTSCDYSPVDFDKTLKLWLVNCESYPYGALMEKQQIQYGSEKHEELNHMLTSEQNKFEEQVKHEQQAFDFIKQAKQVCNVYLKSLQQELVDKVKKDANFIALLREAKNETNLDKEDFKRGIDYYLGELKNKELSFFEADQLLEKKYKMMCDLVSMLDAPEQNFTEKASVFHNQLGQYSTTIAKRNDTATNKFISVMNAVLKALHLPIPNSFKNKGKVLIDKISGTSLFKTAEDEKTTNSNIKNSDQLRKK